ncbi:MAG: response regulator [Planctomycetota bacterium]
MATQAAAKALVIGGHAASAATLSDLLAGLPIDLHDSDAIETLARRLRSCGIDAEAREIDPAELSATAMDERDEQSQVLLNAIGEGVCLAARAGRVLWGNQFFMRLPDDAREQIIEVLRSASEVFQRRGASDDQLGACKFEVCCDVGLTAYEVFVTPAPPRGVERGDLGEAAEDRQQAEDRAEVHGAERVAGVIRDVTAARRTTAKLDAIDRAGYELVRLDAEAVRGKNTFERLKLLEEKIVRLTRDVLEYDHFAIFLIDQPKNKLELVVSEGLPREISDLHLAPEITGSGTSGYVAATGESYICHDASADQTYLPGLPGGRSSLTVPLRLHDEVIGVMDVESRQPHAFSDEDRQFLEIFARHVAMALHMLDLLVVERCAVNTTVSGRVGEELSEPLDDIVSEIDCLRSEGRLNQDDSHLARIIDDVLSIRERLRSVADGPRTLLGVERAMQDDSRDPIIAGKRVLIADDEAKIRKIIGQLLDAKGATVTVCSDGAEACRAIEEAGAQPFDLVLSDIRMPDRNGYEVFSAAKKASTETPVILMTGFGYDPHHSIVRASQQGLQAVLFKPFEIEQMLTEVRAALTPADDAAI